jgi:uncharacterized protein YbbC (DUF1343 family)
MGAMSVTLGSERLLASGALDGLRIGVVANAASVDGSFRHIVDHLAAAPGVTLAAIFGPQHGVQADVQDNMIETAHAADRVRRVPVYSHAARLGADRRDARRHRPARRRPQDGRSHLHLRHTMANCLRAARRAVRITVCDRRTPSAAGGQGPMLVPGYESFVGMFPIPMRPGMTMGELARLFNEHFGIGADLEVVTMEGWQRRMYHDDTGLPWVMPSPNMPTLDTAIVYPGSVLFEGTLLSEGRGTTRPFEIVGMPGIDADRFAARMNELHLEGARFRPVYFEPTFQKHAGRPCGGCQIHVTDRASFRPVGTAVSLLGEFRLASPGQFAWRQPPYEYEYEKMPIDILAGSDELRRQIEAGLAGGEIAAGWTAEVEAFLEVRRRFLLY